MVQAARGLHYAVTIFSFFLTSEERYIDLAQKLRACNKIVDDALKRVTTREAIWASKHAHGDLEPFDQKIVALVEPRVAMIGFGQNAELCVIQRTTSRVVGVFMSDEELDSWRAACCIVQAAAMIAAGDAQWMSTLHIDPLLMLLCHAVSFNVVGELALVPRRTDQDRVVFDAMSDGVMHWPLVAPGPFYTVMKLIVTHVAAARSDSDSSADPASSGTTSKKKAKNVDVCDMYKQLLIGVFRFWLPRFSAHSPAGGSFPSPEQLQKLPAELLRFYGVQKTSEAPLSFTTTIAIGPHKAVVTSGGKRASDTPSESASRRALFK